MKKPPVVVCVGLLLTALSVLVYCFAPASLLYLGERVYDVFLRRAARPPQSGQVAVVDIDEASLSELGQWPWPRYLLARMTDRLFDAGASVVAFDVIFPEADRTSPAHVAAGVKRHLGADLRWDGLSPEAADFDATFAAALRGKPAVLACVMNPSDEVCAHPDVGGDTGAQSPIFTRTPRGCKWHGDPHPFLMQADAVTVSIPVLAGASSRGAIMRAGEDIIVRRVPMVWALGEKRLYPSLSLEAIRLHAGSGQCLLTYTQAGVEAIRVGDILMPVDRVGRLALNFRTLKYRPGSGFVSSFPVYSAAKVLAAGFEEDAFKGRIVFVGTSAAGLKDLRATPLTPVFSGVEVHATAVDNILAGDALHHPAWTVAVDLFAIVLIGLLMTWIVGRGAPWVSFGAAIVLAGAVGWGSYALLVWAHTVFSPVWIVGTIALIYPVLTTVRFWQTELHRRRVRRMFATMVSRDVLKYLEDNPECFSLTGRKTEATMCFSDVSGFTAIAEVLAPERLSELLNRYLSPMTHIIMERHGYVDKYEGDLIMAEWGVPYPMDDHAAQACMAALDKQKALATLRPVLKEEFGHEIHVRMGINTGVVTAGNMGSEQRFQFTVMGDAVNQASRLEPANKDYGTNIIIGESTYEAAKEQVEARLLDRVLVRGKRQPVRIYELLARKGELGDMKREAVALYEQALHLYWDRQWTEALSKLAEARATCPDDGPSEALDRRIRAYAVDPPPPDWDGVHVLLERE